MSGVLSLYPRAVPPESPDPLYVNDVEVVPGVEINSQWNGRELHVLGYYTPAGAGPFRRFLDDMQAAREERARLTAAKLERLGMPVELSRVLELSAGDSVGRPHVAQAMVERGYVRSVKEAFERYLGIGRPAYVERLHLEPKAAVRAIAAAGGVPVWAHPGTSHALHLVKGLVEEGLLGIEAFHPEHDHRMSEKCLLLAEEYGLVVTGGSDFHGLSAGEGGDLGSTVVPYAVVSRLKQLAFR
jgi:hypothetical protein